ncbi:MULTISPECIES: hypothetical protein [unclassified Pseudomonas]|uniref:hypothetical protein n=1 Tax=unclassified Pseudomonas TaxID=196821 RepID=UPI000DA8A719|nr:hypothetical protein DMX10_10895 [Pseudomonas sp. 57B-090624]
MLDASIHAGLRTPIGRHGGAIALGHSPGASGARPALTVCRTLQCKNPRVPLVSLGVGLGQGVAVVLERP